MSRGSSKSTPTSELLLPGNTSPLNEAYVFARAAGYLKKRYVDIGDHVREGQIMAEIEEPDLDQQVLQARASLAQTRGALGQTQASLEQSQAQLRLQDVTLRRIKTLVTRGVLSQQQGDQAQADYDNAAALVKVAEANVFAAQENVKASEANLARLIELQGYEKIRAPFSGVVTARSVDAGALISANGAGQGTPNLGTTNAPPGSSSELFRVAQVGTLRILVNVPQGYAPEIHVGTQADVTLQGSNRKYTGKVTRTAQSLDQTTRTMLTEVQVVNRDGSLLPGMYTDIRFKTNRLDPPLLIPGDSLVVRPKGPMVAVLRDGNKVHFEPVNVGPRLRDGYRNHGWPPGWRPRDYQSERRCPRRRRSQAGGRATESRFHRGQREQPGSGKWAARREIRPGRFGYWHRSSTGARELGQRKGRRRRHVRDSTLTKECENLRFWLCFSRQASALKRSPPLRRRANAPGRRSNSTRGGQYRRARGSTGWAIRTMPARLLPSIFGMAAAWPA